MKSSKALVQILIAFTLVTGADDAFAKGKKKVEAVTTEESSAAVDDESMSAKLVVGGSAPASAVASPIAVDGGGGDAVTKASVTADSNAAIDAALAAAATATAAVGGTNEVDAKKIDTNKLSENEIPVLAAAKNEKKSEGSPIFKILMTLGVLAVALGGAAYGLKRMAARTGKKAQTTQIRVLTTHHLGPKKNLQIIQVAGETLLIGVTDHNITMLKTLALIDDELPANVPQQFNHSMEDFADEDEMEPVALRGLDQIRDTVSARLKNMRNL